MPSRVVEAITGGVTVAVYPIGMYRMPRRVTDADFVEAAQDFHRDAGGDVEAVGEWRVRRLRPGEYADDG